MSFLTAARKLIEKDNLTSVFQSQGSSASTSSAGGNRQPSPSGSVAPPIVEKTDAFSHMTQINLGRVGIPNNYKKLG